MSRLGDLIRTERLRSKLTPKQVARKCGVAESYIIAVEAGTRIIADDQARRILRTIGVQDQTEADFSLEDIAATVDLAQVSPQMAAPQKSKPALTRPDAAPAEEKSEGVTGSVWLDALTSVLKNVPVMNAVMKPVDHRLVPIQNGKIEGAHPGTVLYLLAPDDSMRGFRIHAGDVALMVPAQSPVDGAVMLVEHNNHRFLRKVKKLDAVTILLQSYDREYDAQTVHLSECAFLGRAVKVEYSL